MIPSSPVVLWLKKMGIVSRQRSHGLCPRGENSLQSNEDVRRSWYYFLLPFYSLCRVFRASYNRKIMNKIHVIHSCSTGSNFIPQAIDLFGRIYYKDQPSKSTRIGKEVQTTKRPSLRHQRTSILLLSRVYHESFGVITSSKACFSVSPALQPKRSFKNPSVSMSPLHSE